MDRRRETGHVRLVHWMGTTLCTPMSELGVPDCKIPLYLPLFASSILFTHHLTVPHDSRCPSVCSFLSHPVHGKFTPRDPRGVSTKSRVDTVLEQLSPVDGCRENGLGTSGLETRSVGIHTGVVG